MKKAALILALLIAALCAVVGVRTAMLQSRQAQVEPAGVEALGIDTQQAADRLARSLEFKTISYGVPSPLSKDEFLAFHRFLEETYPRTHATLQREIVNNFSLLYTWPGRNPGLDPLMLLGHFDVVPVAPDTESAWKHPPFSGAMVDGEIWGRGAVDDKINVIGIMEAVEYLVAQDYQPDRTVLIAFGHDEEAGGTDGAKAVAAMLEERGIRPACVVDEGGFIISDVVPGVDQPVALVGIAEKGYVTLQLTANHEGGHSSTPPRKSAVGIMATAIHRLEEDPFPSRIDGIPRLMLETLAPEMAFPYNMVMGNFWLTKPVIARILAANPKTDATMRTTIAATTISGGVKENVLPTEVTATVNHRIYPGETIDTVMARVKGVIADDRITVEVVDSGPSNPSPVSPVDSDAYAAIEKSVRQVAPDVVVAPYLVLGATDARHFYTVSDHVYRIVTVRLESDEVAMVHGTNERIAVDNVGEVVAFYVQLIRNFDE